ncbi:MAG: hypothetical protein QOE27_6 [Solirubrobacteraceae bacterium]|jgi:hypothetical protein|nr:hypothetical protein [Solirubrobacteraceae bacterium]MEA2302282.1 hypothetical protein [Solirubrobacteraceae bacterium]MEA2354753.1 hypothetical protein [Solirubrobacteraceae bacterium]
MTQAIRRILKPELGGSVPSGLEALTEDELTAFAGVVRGARRRQSQELEAAVEQALDIVPRLLRGTIRRILFG